MTSIDVVLVTVGLVVSIMAGIVTIADSPKTAWLVQKLLELAKKGRELWLKFSSRR